MTGKEAEKARSQVKETERGVGGRYVRVWEGRGRSPLFENNAPALIVKATATRPLWALGTNLINRRHKC